MVAIIMGSDSDLPVMRQAAEFLDQLGIQNHVTIVSAHRTPDRMFDFAKTAHQRGFKAIIAGAGGAAHLPGMVAALSPLPVIGVPVKSSNSIDGAFFYLIISVGFFHRCFHNLNPKLSSCIIGLSRRTFLKNDLSLKLPLPMRKSNTTLPLRMCRRGSARRICSGWPITTTPSCWALGI